jgi:oligopeptide/dipeptide ABC transporter ATP-binding protein
MSFLEVENLRTYFFTRRGTVKAVDGVNFHVEKGETFGLVGESGCGKSMTCLSILRLVPQPAGRIVDGRIRLDGEDLLKKTEEEMRKIRGSKVSMILQDPMTSLNPVFTIGNQITEALKIHLGLKGRPLWERARKMLELVRIASPEIRLRNWPHQLSGGMRQRVVGAISLSCEPQLLIADEPTTSLDATIQMQYLRLLREIQQKNQLTLIFITHDLGIVAKMCQRAAVMYAGKIVETASIRDLFNRPAHPYTQALLRSIPKVEEKVSSLASIEGQPPPLHSLPPGCIFRSRCTQASPRCQKEEFPPSLEIDKDHWVSCWKYVPERST